MRALVPTLTLIGFAALAIPACSSSSEDEGGTSEAAKDIIKDIDGKFAAIKEQTSAVCDPATNKPKTYVVKDEEPISKAPDRDYNEDTKAKASADGTFDVAAYIAKRKGPQRKFAGATVLAAMRRLRRYYTTRPYEAISGGGVKISKLEGAHGLAPKAIKTCDIAFASKFDTCELTFNESDDGQTGGNMGVMPGDWSELQAHLFPMAPHYRHACWTRGMRGFAGGNCKNPFGTGNEENAYIATDKLCSGEGELDTSKEDCAGLTHAYDVLPATLSAYNLLWVNPRTNEFVPLPEEVRTNVPSDEPTPAAVTKILGARFAKTQREAGNVNVWEYVMHSQTYAFDWEQQQAVLNAYYNDNKAMATGKDAPFNPCDEKECAKWRPTRPSDPSDGTHCRTQKLVNAAMVSRGPWMTLN